MSTSTPHPSASGTPSSSTVRALSPLAETPAVLALAEEALGVGLELRAARSLQWYPSPRPSTPDNAGVRASGLVDPVPSIVADPRRLAVRAAVVDGERTLDRAVAALGVARRRVETALAEYRATE